MGLGSFLQGLIDVIGIDIAFTARGEEVGVDEGVFIATIGKDVVDTSGQRLDWAGAGASAFHMDGFTFYSILLIANAQRCFHCSVQVGLGGSVGDDVVVGIPKGDVVNDESFGLSILALLCILAYPEEVEESNVAEVSNGQVLGFVAALPLAG